MCTHGTNVIEHLSDTTKVLIKMIALLERVGNSFQSLIIILGMRSLHLLGLGDVVLQIPTCMFVGL